MHGEPTPNSGEYLMDKPAPAIAPEGMPIVIGFVIGSALLTAAANWLAWWLWGALAGRAAASSVGLVTGAITIWCVWFFRDPHRRIPRAGKSGSGGTPLISPADGVVCFVGPALPPAELKLPEQERQGLARVSVFMNVFNVHVNRSPAAGKVERLAYRPGKFFNASFDKASSDNERMSMLLRLADGTGIVCVQIAGLIARRSVCRVREGAVLEPGERDGLIRFGSRVDVYVSRAGLRRW